MLLARATGLRIGELVDLELDEQTVVPVDRICVHPSSGRPLPHPKTGRPTEFLLAHHGRWVSVYLLRDVLTRVTRNAGLPTPPHSCDIPTPPPWNAGVSLQSLMALLGHVSATMSLRYGRLFDAIVRGEYERALTAAKDHLGSLPAEPPGGRISLPISTAAGKQTPTVKARLADGFCVRAQV